MFTPNVFEAVNTDKVRPFASNMRELNTSLATILISYNTPVAAFMRGRGWIRTDAWYSNTTTRHINKWLRHYADRGLLLGRNVETVSQAVLDTLCKLQ